MIKNAMDKTRLGIYLILAGLLCIFYSANFIFQGKSHKYNPADVPVNSKKRRELILREKDPFAFWRSGIIYFLMGCVLILYGAKSLHLI